jgi:hypothetical protein
MEGVVAVAAAAVGYLLRPVSDWITNSLGNKRIDSERRRLFQFETLQELSSELEQWRYGGGTITSETHKARVEVLIFKVNDDELRRLVELMFVTRYDDPVFENTYGDVVRRLGRVQREL